MEPSEVYSAIMKEAGDLPWFSVCYTGGEPFLQQGEQLRELTELLWDDGRVEFTECFSNGTILYPDWATEGVAFILDWKLPGSGESHADKRRVTNVSRLATWNSVIKFTIADPQDYAVAKEIAKQHDLENRGFSIYYGVVWNKLTDSQLIGWVLADNLSWIHNMQVHNYIWDRRKRGI